MNCVETIVKKRDKWSWSTVWRKAGNDVALETEVKRPVEAGNEREKQVKRVNVFGKKQTNVKSVNLRTDLGSSHLERRERRRRRRWAEFSSVRRSPFFRTGRQTRKLRTFERTRTEFDFCSHFQTKKSKKLPCKCILNVKRIARNTRMKKRNETGWSRHRASSVVDKLMQFRDRLSSTITLIRFDALIRLTVCLKMIRKEANKSAKKRKKVNANWRPITFFAH